MGMTAMLLYVGTWVSFGLINSGLLILVEPWRFCYWKIKILPMDRVKSDLNSILYFVIFMNIVLSFFG